MTTFLCYDKCSTCQKAQKWLEERGAAYTARPIKEQNPTAAELESWLAESGLPVKRPVLITDKGVCPGFKPEEWEKLL